MVALIDWWEVEEKERGRWGGKDVGGTKTTTVLRLRQSKSTGLGLLLVIIITNKLLIIFGFEFLIIFIKHLNSLSFVLFFEKKINLNSNEELKIK